MTGYSAGELLELTFFVRAWAWGQPGVVAEIIPA